MTFADSGIYDWFTEIQSNPEAINTRPDIEFTSLRIAAIILSFILIIYLLISFSFAEYFVFFGEMPFWKAIEASRRVIGRNWFKFFGLVLLFGFGFFIISMTLALISSFLGAIFVFLYVIGFIVLGLIAFAWFKVAFFSAFDEVIGTNFSNDKSIESHLVDNSSENDL